MEFNMNTNTTNTLRVATLLALGMLGQHAVASNMSMSSPYMFALEQGAPSSSTVADLSSIADFDIPVIANKTIENTKPYYVKITLTGGAIFGAEPTLTCPYDDGAGGSTDVAAVSDVLGNGQASVSFKLESGTMNGSVCVLSDLSVQLKSGAKDYGVSVSARYVPSNVNNAASASWDGSFVSFAQALQLAVKAGGVTVDVRDSYGGGKEFYKPTTNPSGYTVVKSGIAKLGTLYFENSNGYYGFGTTPAAIVPSDIVTTLKLVVSGVPISVVTTAAPTTPLQTASIFIDATTADITQACQLSGAEYTTPTTIVPDISVSAISGSYVTITDLDVGAAFNPLGAAAAAGDAGSGIDICMQVNGSSSIPKGMISFSLEATDLGSPSYTPNLTVVSPTLVNVVKNGASIKVLNIPSPTNATDAPFIRVYNMGSAKAKVKGTLYSQGTNDSANTGGGSVLGTPDAVLIDSLAPNAVGVLDVAALAKAFGVTDWPGRAWLQIESDIQSVRVQALVRAGGPGGTLVNLSDRIISDNEAICRSDYSDKCSQ
jgi:hypothetical protein